MNFRERMSAIMVNLKKPEKVIAFFALLVAVLCFTVVLIGAFPVDGAAENDLNSLNDKNIVKQLNSMMPADVPLPLTWEAVEGLVDGKLTYRELFDTYDYSGIGAGVCTYTFAIEDTQPFTLLVISGDSINNPVLVGLHSENNHTTLDLNKENLTRMMSLREASLQKYVSELFYNEIPVPDDAKIKDNTLIMTGKNPDQIIHEYLTMLSDNGLKKVTAARMKRYYEKTINGKNMTVSVLSMQEGGLQEKDMDTVIQINIEEAPSENERKISSIEITPENAARLQEVADKGENLWLLDPKSVTVIMLGLKGGYFTNAAGETPSITLEYSYEYEKVVVELCQPVKTGESGIWMVKSYKDVPITKNSSSSNDAQKEEIEVEFDSNVKSDGNTIIIEPSQIIKASPELIEQAREWKEEFQKPIAGLFDTELDIKQQDSGVKLVFSLYNISEEDLKLNFDMGREFDFFVANNEGDEVHRWSHGKDIYLPAITKPKLKKGEKLTFSEVWDCTDNEGYKVLSGKYSITVKLNAKLENRKNINPDELTALKDIEVELLSDGTLKSDGISGQVDKTLD